MEDSQTLIRHITQVLYENNKNWSRIPEPSASSTPSAVLLLLGKKCEISAEPCLILNKRSQNVRQPGDLCCPGGSVSPVFDSWFAKLLSLPGFPIWQWKYWQKWRRQSPHQAKNFSLFFATSLRESFEEMRLNPFGVTCLGPLPPQRLVIFKRIIYPMAGWISHQKRFFPNWEVERIVYIPLRYLLIPDNYARYQITFSSEFNRGVQEFPCFVYETEESSELLWGATYRIVTIFLEMVFGFKPPTEASLPVITGNLTRNYVTRKSRK